jgi:hypothetical protein
MSHDRYYGPRDTDAQIFDTSMQKLRRALKAATAYGLPVVTVHVPRSGFDKSAGRLVRFVSDGVEVYAHLLAHGGTFNIGEAVSFMFSKLTTITREDARALYDLHDPGAKREAKAEARAALLLAELDSDFHPYDKNGRDENRWKIIVQRARRQLADACKIFGLDLRLRVRRKKSELLQCDIVDASGTVLPESVIESGFYLQWIGGLTDHVGNRTPLVIIGAFKPYDICLDYMKHGKPESEHEAIERHWETELYRNVETMAERLDFNRWKPNPPAAKAAIEAHSKGLDYAQHLGLYRAHAQDWFKSTKEEWERPERLIVDKEKRKRRDALRKLEKEERKAFMVSRERAAQLVAFKALPESIRRAAHRCYKGGLILETASLEELKARNEIREKNIKLYHGNTWYTPVHRRNRKPVLMDERWKQVAPVRVMQADGSWITVVPEPKRKRKPRRKAAEEAA